MNSRTLNQTVAVAFGAVYILVGVIGFAVTNEVGFAAREGRDLLGIFEVNPLHNIVHLAIGALLLLGGLASAAAARAVNAIVGATYLVVGLAGLVMMDSRSDILALNSADNVLHLGSALLLLGVSIFAGNRMMTGAETTERSRMGARH